MGSCGSLLPAPAWGLPLGTGPVLWGGLAGLHAAGVFSHQDIPASMAGVTVVRQVTGDVV